MRYPFSLRKTTYRRRIFYVDAILQKWLLVGLVVLEAGLAGGLAWLMHWRLNLIVEQNLYRVHLDEVSPMYDQLMHETLFLLGAFTLANAIALLVVNIIWRRYLHSVLRHFRTLIDKTIKLDFSTDLESTSLHPVLALAETQRAQERVRLAAIRKLISNLGAEVSAQKDMNRMRDLLKSLDEILPRPSQKQDL